MQNGDVASRLKIYISSTDKYEHAPLYEAIVYAARKNGIAGATVTRGIMGYGTSSKVYTTKLWELSEKTPLIVEIIDKKEKVENLLELLKPLFEKSGKGHIITIEDTRVAIHRTGRKPNEPYF